jgi:hypothetical protein
MRVLTPRRPDPAKEVCPAKRPVPTKRHDLAKKV